MRSRATILLIVCLSALFAACSNEPDKLAKEIKEAVSWLASARLVTDAYASGAVPEPYARDAIENFHRQLQVATGRVQKISDPRTLQAVSTLQQSQQTLTQIAAAVNSGERDSLMQLTAEVGRQQNTLSSLIYPQPGQQ